MVTEDQRMCRRVRLTVGLGIDTFSKGDEVSVFIEHAELARPPRPSLERCIRVNDTLRTEFIVQLIDTSDVHPTTGVLGNISLWTGPKMDLNVVPNHDAPSARLEINLREPEPRTIKGNRALNVE
jgi:hypothetical protein